MRTWKIDTAHSEIKFKVKHLLVSTVTGQFNSFDGTIESSDIDFDGAKVRFEADINSINTNNEMRDNHLKSADFFDAANYPRLMFISKSFRKTTGNDYEMKGDMTIRGIKKEITLKVKYNGSAKGMDGSDIAGFEIYGSLNRFDFGLQWNALTEAGGMAVSSDVKIEINTELKNVSNLGLAA